MGRCVGLSGALVNVNPGGFYPVDWPVPETFTGRGRWRSGALHTFVDDYRQEFCWRNPEQGLLVAIAAGVCTAPDFTIWLDDPVEWRRFQAWRSALVAGYWSAWGVHVLPVISFGSGCEDYVSSGSTWAVRGPGRRSDQRAWWRQLVGFVERVDVGRLVVFGKEVPECQELGVPVLNRRLVQRSVLRAA